jgi:hypothetical protein
MKLSFPTKVINGQISSNRQPIAEAIKSFEGKEIVLTIERKRKKRSNEQNAYLWGVVYPILKDGFYQIGYKLTTEEVHELMKQSFVNPPSSHRRRRTSCRNGELASRRFR